MLKNKIKLSKIQIIILVVLVVVILGTITTGTYAWLSGKTKLLNSSFTYGDIEISINDSNETNNYEIMPGDKITKETSVNVKAKSEDCWLYIKIDKSVNFDEYMTYEMADGWINLEGNDNVYYREVSKMSSNQEFGVIKDNLINVKSELTKEMLNSIGENYPTFTVTAYAVQRDKNIETLNTALEAWQLLEGQE